MLKKLLTLILLLFILFVTGCSFFFKDDDPYDGYKKYYASSSYSDSDHDGIPDVAEVSKTLFEGMPLFDWGARPGIRDIFIHVATMDYVGSDGGLYLQKDALDAVVAAFQVQNIAVHFDVGEKGLYQGYSAYSGGEYNLDDRDNQVPYAPSIFLDGRYGHSTTVMEYKLSNFPSKRYNIFYFMVFGSSQNLDGSGGSSGVSYIGGTDFLITFANWNMNYTTGNTISVNWQASTIMHEFGHSLGLHHGGAEDQNYKPNYFSIMNYLYQLNGLPAIGNNEGDRYYYETLVSGYDSLSNLQNSPYTSSFLMDYSHGSGGDLAESNLNENNGLRQTGSTGIDWDHDADPSESSVSVDINATYRNGSSSITNSTNAGSNSILKDYDDWGNLYFYFYSRNSSGTSRVAVEKDWEIAEEDPLMFHPLSENP